MNLAAIQMPLSPLFSGITDSEVRRMLACFRAAPKTYNRNDFVFRVGESVNEILIILSGKLLVTQEDMWGNRRILESLTAGQTFGESYACLNDEVLNVSVIAAEKTQVLFVDINHLLEVCANTCETHMRLIHNLTGCIARQNINLTRKINHITKKNTREKLLSFLTDEAGKCGSATFDIAFNRQQLADYLAVDRSAMSAELSKLQKEGILTYSQNHFTLLVQAEDMV